MNGNLLQLALRELREVFTSRISRVGLVLAVAALTVSGPFGTFERYNLGQRFLYWGAMVLCCYLTGTIAANIFLALLQKVITQRWPRVIVAGLLTGVPVAVVVFAIASIASRSIDLRFVLPLWLDATLVTLVVISAMVLIRDQMQVVPASTAPVGVVADSPDMPAPAVATPPAPPSILTRVPLPQRGRLLALLVEDHYVDIVTDKGKTLVLMRLADAMRETGGVPGLQVHRSHWVARDAVVKTHRGEGKVVLELSNGMRLPVSRGYLPAVREAGLG